MPAYSHGHSHTAASSPAPTVTSSLATTPWPDHTTSGQEPYDPYSVNTTHLELFNNLSSKEFLPYEHSGQPDIIPVGLYIKHALTIPCLMHQLLAISSFHLSTKIATSESRNHYSECATGLQTRALSLFHKSNAILEATSANCVPMFLFSSAVGVHLLCDILLYQQDSLERFIDKFTHCLNVQRGVLAIIDQARHLLQDTELASHLNISQVFMTTNTTGSECDVIMDLVNSADVSPSSRHAYRDSIAHLQQVFDAERAADVSGDKLRTSLIFAWPVVLSSEYVDLLHQRQPEALVILAHYATIVPWPAFVVFWRRWSLPDRVYL